MSRDLLADLSARDLLADVAKGSLAPGGISMAALAGAIAGSLVVLVGRLTAGHEGYEPLTEEMERLLDRAKVLQEQLLALMDQEVEAFNQLVGSFSLPKGSSEEQAIRRDCVRIARRGYLQVPLQIGSLGMEVLELAEKAVRYGNREVLADAGAGYFAAAAAVKSAALQVLINLRGYDDEWAIASREKAEKWMDELPALEGEIWTYLVQQVKD